MHLSSPSLPPSLPLSLPPLPPSFSHLHVQVFTAGAGFADVVMEVEADAAASDHIAGHALKDGGLRKG